MNRGLIITALVSAALAVVAWIAWPSITSHRQSAVTQEEPAPALPETIETVATQVEEGATMPQTNQALVIYFSRADENYDVGVVERGNTALLADVAVAHLGADAFQIVPTTPYPAEYDAATQVAQQERTAGARPTYQGEIDLSAYTTIYLGYPIWWGDLPMVVYTFLENHDFTGKTVYLFNTHEGSGSAGTYQTVAQLLPTATVHTDGFALAGHTARTQAGQDQFLSWLTSLEEQN